LVENSNTVEQLMCAKEWSSIEYSKLPSKAMSGLMRSFKKNDKERFEAYLQSVSNGETKINTGAVYPYDIIKNLRFGDIDGANVQWDALPNYLESNNERLLPVVDVSGSMSCSAGNNPNLTCLDVAVSLGLYISERNVGSFKDAFITFSDTPELQVLGGSLAERYVQLASSDWSMSTNLESVFNLILNKAIESSVSQNEMPSMILVLSDMEFNEATSWDLSAQKMIERMYFEAGYEMPKIVYWNIHAMSSNFPVHFDENATCLVSGFSPSILTNLLSGNDMTPYSMMLNVINSERYSRISI
jgi:hypothetical protein